MLRQKLGMGILAWSLWFSGVALAQVTTGTISGTVKDSTGAVVPGAAITLKDVDTGLTRRVTSDSAGRYRAPQLALGNYEVTTEAAGFQTLVRTGIAITVGREATLDFTLQVGTVSQQITVTGEAPLIESTNATVSGLVNEKAMRDLPLNGRSFTDLTALQPGVVTNLGVAQTVFSGGGRMVINGARPQQSLYLLDGTDIVAPYSNTAPVSVMGEVLGVDTVREFSVLQNNYGAQYGRAIGGIVNSVTRSGANAFHGSAFEFLRNSAFDAKNFFDRSDLRIPEFQRNQFGGTMGGPIQKDRTFFFFGYEGLRQNLGVTRSATVVSNEARTGNITNCPPGMAQCSPSQAITQQRVPVNPDIAPSIHLLPLGNGVYLNDGLQRFADGAVQPGRENNFVGRLDRQFSTKDAFFGRLTEDTSGRETPDWNVLPDGTHPATNDVGRYVWATAAWTRVFSASLLNTARVGFARNANGACQCLPGTGNKIVDTFPGLPPQLQVVPGRPFGPSTFFTGITPPSGQQWGSTSIQGTPENFIDNTFDYSDSLHYARGRHSLEIGGNFKRYQEDELNSTWGNAQLTWLTPMANLLTAGTCSGCGGIQTINTTGVTQPPDAYRGWRQTYGAWYVQDEFRLLSNLTLNIGVRWERVTGPVEVNGKAATWKDVLHDTGWTQLGKNPLFRVSDAWKNFAPRIGFAYSPDQKTSIRGGWGLFKEIPLEYDYSLAIYYPPFAQRSTVTSIHRWPNPLQGVNPNGPTNQPLVANYDFKYPYAYQWNFGVERQFGGSWVGKVRYIGTRGFNLVGVLNELQPALSTDAQGVPFMRSGSPSTNPVIDSTRSYGNFGDSWYNALQFVVEKRFSYGWQLNASYTWSKNLSDVGIGLETAQFFSGAATGTYQIGNLWNYKSYDWGRADMDAPRNLILNTSYELPIGQNRFLGKNMGPVANVILGGWQVNAIFSDRSGLPVFLLGGGYNSTPYCHTCILRPNLKPGGNNNPVTGKINGWFDVSQFTPAVPGYFGNLGKNTLAGPALAALDFSLFKAFRVAEAKNLTFRAEFFNLLNHPNFGYPNPTVFTTSGAVNPSAGAVLNTVTTSRQIQFALKFEF